MPSVRNVDTRVDAEALRQLNRALLAVPDGFTIHPRLQRILSRRHTALDDPNEAAVDWSMAEQLAFATILADGIALVAPMDDEEGEETIFSARFACPVCGPQITLVASSAQPQHAPYAAHG